MHERSKVLWIGGPPSEVDLRGHTWRALALRDVGLDALAHDAIALARRLMLKAVPLQVPDVVQAPGGVASASSHDLHVMVLLADNVAHEWVQKQLEARVEPGPARGRVRYRVASTAYEVADSFSTCDPGPALNRALVIHDEEAA